MALSRGALVGILNRRFLIHGHFVLRVMSHAHLSLDTRLNNSIADPVQVYNLILLVFVV